MCPVGKVGTAGYKQSSVWPTESLNWWNDALLFTFDVVYLCICRTPVDKCTLFSPLNSGTMVNIVCF